MTKESEKCEKKTERGRKRESDEIRSRIIRNYERREKNIINKKDKSYIFAQK